LQIKNKACNMFQKSKYQIAKFVILSVLIIYFLYFKYGLPIVLILILELLLVIKLLPLTPYIEKQIIKYYPRYNNFNKWKKRLILLICFILIYMILKYLIINIIMTKILNIPVEEQIYDFINKTR